MGRHRPAWTVFLAAASLGVGCGNDNAGAGGNGSGGATSSETTGGPSSTSSKASSSASKSASAGTGGAPFVCDPAAPADSLYATTAVTYGLDTISMCQYRGDVLLIVDTAAA